MTYSEKKLKKNRYIRKLSNQVLLHYEIHGHIRTMTNIYDGDF